MAAYRRLYDYVTNRLAAKNRDQRRNLTLGNRVWATFTFFIRPTCYKLCVSMQDALEGSKCNSQAPPSTSFVDHTNTRVAVACRPEFEAKFQKEVSLFLKVPKFPYNTV